MIIRAKPLSFWIDPDSSSKLRNFANLANMSQSEIIRWLINEADRKLHMREDDDPWFNPHRIYLAEMKSADERFLKIGISISVAARITALGGNYKTRLITTSVPLTPKSAFKAEKMFLKELKDYAYVPMVEFGGKTECLRYDKEVIELIKDHSLFKKPKELRITKKQLLLEASEMKRSRAARRFLGGMLAKIASSPYA
jgi:T5orf172 domain